VAQNRSSLQALTLLPVLVIAAALTVPASAAGTGSYKSCDVRNGQVFACNGAWYQGSAVTRHGGAYHECKIVNGQVFSCTGSWYQGTAVVLQDNAYRLCKIVNGQVFACDGAWYQGKAVVFTDR
jgi:hypothetical protein